MKLNFTWNKNTAIGVVLFIIVLVLAVKSSMARADTPTFEPYLELGHSFSNTHSVMAGAGIVYRGRYEFGLHQMGHGEANGGEPRVVGMRDGKEIIRGIQPVVRFASLSRIVDPGWRVLGADFKVIAGLAYTDGIVVCGKYSFNIGVMLDWKFVKVRIIHNSNAGTEYENTGLDYLTQRIPL